MRWLIIGIIEQSRSLIRGKNILSKLVLLVFGSIFLFGCGGSGSSENTFDGKWVGSLTLLESSDDCSSSPESLEVEFLVFSEDDMITVESNTLTLPLRGEASSDSSFETNFGSGSAVVASFFSLDFTNVEEDSAFAVYTDSQGVREFDEDDGTLENSTICTELFEGVVTRQF